MEWIMGVCVAMGMLMMSWWFVWRKNDEAKGKVPKGNSGWPLIGETLDYISSGYSSNLVSFLHKRKSLYGNVFKTRILGSNLIISTDPEVNKVILQNHGNFIPAYPKSIRELMGEQSILKMNSTTHKKVHTLIAGFLRSPQCKARITTDIQLTVKQCLASWSHQIQPIYIQDQVKKITFPVLVKVLMGVGPGQDLDFLSREFAEFIKGLICVPLKFPGTTLYKSLKAKQRMVKMVRKIVEERKKALMDNNGDGAVNDVVDVLLRDKVDSDSSSRLTPEMISQNIIEMMIPGEETLPTAMTTVIKFLSDSPLALSKLQEENMELKMLKANSSDDYTWSDYMSLPFTQNVISETLRMANIVNGIWRKSVQDIEIKGYLIPKDWGIMASLTSVHMDDKNYENPYNFNPWRWEKIGVVASNNYYTPFGGGPRLCPGLELSRLELAIFLHHLVTTYSWVAERDEIVYFPTVKMKRKLPISVQPTNP
ncbi:hypothetical protein Fmac_002571 [Flemingia macrophylla]|uniref:22alpha-hydroxysteroid 23-monooxygenase n=1 Tax=Flemingia macrophylla TaxID=520843 RepID=A0ABD1NKX3_9FABA